MAETDNKKLVAFADILGFRDLVNRNSHAELQSIYSKFRGTSLDALSRGKSWITEQGIRIPNLDDVHLQMMIISDSVILWSKEENLRSYFDMIITIRELICRGLMFDGFPMRAGISYGEFEQINEHSEHGIYSMSTFFGKGMTKAYELSESQNWAGAVIDEFALEAYMEKLEGERKIAQIPEPTYNKVTIEGLLAQDILKKYRVPFKNSPREEFTINWNSIYPPPKPDVLQTRISMIKGAFSAYKKQNNSERGKVIMNNTLEYFELTRGT